MELFQYQVTLTKADGRIITQVVDFTREKKYDIHIIEKFNMLCNKFREKYDTYVIEFIGTIDESKIKVTTPTNLDEAIIAASAANLRYCETLLPRHKKIQDDAIKLYNDLCNNTKVKCEQCNDERPIKNIYGGMCCKCNDKKIKNNPHIQDVVYDNDIVYSDIVYP